MTIIPLCRMLLLLTYATGDDNNAYNTIQTRIPLFVHLKLRMRCVNVLYSTSGKVTVSWLKIVGLGLAARTLSHETASLPHLLSLAVPYGI